MAPGKTSCADCVKNIFRLRSLGKTLTEISKECNRGPSWISKILNGFDPKSGLKKVRRPRGRKRIERLDNEELLKVVVDYDPHASFREITAKLNEDHGIKTSVRTVHKRINVIYRSVDEVRDDLTEKHKLTRVSWCREMLDKLNEQPYLFDNVWFSDEASFEMEGGRRKVINTLFLRSTVISYFVAINFTRRIEIQQKESRAKVQFPAKNYGLRSYLRTGTNLPRHSTSQVKDKPGFIPNNVQRTCTSTNPTVGSPTRSAEGFVATGWCVFPPSRNNNGSVWTRKNAGAPKLASKVARSSSN